VKPDPKLVAAIQAALQLTLTVHETDKAYRQIAKRWKYKRLRRWFNRASDRSGQWRLCLEKLLFTYQASTTITLNSLKVDPNAGMISFLTDQGERAMQLRKLYHTAYEVAEQVDDSTAASKLCDLQEDVEEQIADLEAFSRQISDQGPGLWLSTRT